MQQDNISEMLLRLAVHASPSGILIAGGDGCIAFANQALLDMFGYSSDELLGHPIEILVPDEDAEVHRRHRRTFDANPSLRNMGGREHFNGVSKDGRIFPVEIGLRPCETEKGGLVVATVIDITERKLIEDRLHRHEESLEDLVEERTRELQEAQLEKEQVLDQLIQSEKLTAIGTLVSGIGHEINNPLYLVLSMAEMIRDEDDIHSRREFGDEIVKQCRRIAETVKNLSQYARPCGSHELQNVDLNESVAAAVQAAKQSLQSGDIEIRQKTRPVDVILAKPEEIQQVLFNVIRNGIQACTGKGVVGIDTFNKDNRVSVRIRDSGTGIPVGNEKKIFDPFFTTKGPDDGEGLGLYIVRQIVTRHGGTIDLVSDGGSGTTFIIEFPAADRE